MTRLGKALTQVSLLCATILSVPVVAWHPSPRSLNAKRLEAVKRRETSARQAAAGNARRATDTSTSSGVQNITFLNPKVSGAFARVHVHASFVIFFSLHSEFYVDGESIPEVDFDVGPSWSGLMPISGAANETRKVQLFKLGNVTDETSAQFSLTHFPVVLLVLPSGSGRKPR
jgi:carboxypeptidase D